MHKLCTEKWRGDNMQKGDLVQYKSYTGKIRFEIPYNKSVIVTLCNYKGFKEIDKELYLNEIFQIESPI